MTGSAVTDLKLHPGVEMDESSLIVHQKERHGEPLNAEGAPQSLVRTFQTPTEQIFHRNHGDIIKIPTGVAAVEEEWQISFLQYTTLSITIILHESTFA